MVRLIPFLAVMGFLLAGCRDSKPQKQTPHLFVEIFVRFLSPENEYKAQVMFFQGDSLETARPKKLSSGVRFGGKYMREKALGSYAFRYESIQPGPFSARHAFDYADEQGKKRSILLEMSPVEQYHFDTPATKSAGANLSIDGQALGSNETLLLLFTDEQGNSFSVELKDGFRSGKVLLSPKQLAPVPAGNYELYLVKKQERKTTRDHRTIASTIEYYSPIRQVQILD